MNNYFLFSAKNKPMVASAFAPKGIKLAQDLISDLEGINKLPFELDLIKLSVGKSGLIESHDLTDLKEPWLDYQPNSLAWPLMSEKLKTVIEKNLTGNEKIDWLFCKVNSAGEQRIFYVLRFNEKLDVLDLQKTKFVQGTDHIIKPVFSFSKITSYNIFPKPLGHNLWKITPSLYVSEILKKAMQNEKLTGIDFEKTSVV